MRIGAHISTSGRKLKETTLAAKDMGCEAIQLFAANPNSWVSKEIDPIEAKEFKEAVHISDLNPVVIHTQYLINLASPDESIYTKSIAALEDSLDRAEMLGAAYVVTHIGSHKGAGEDFGIVRVCEAVSSVLKHSDSTATLLLENSSGAGNTIGGSLHHIGGILDRLLDLNERLGICLDTAHLWGAGYDVSTKESLDLMINEFNLVVGVNRLKLLHLNDTFYKLDSKKDRHANIGTAQIGEAGFHAILHHPALKEIPCIIETPADRIENHIKDMVLLKQMRD